MNKTPKKKNTYFKNYDLYSDANPADSVPVKYDTKENLMKTIRKLENLYKKGVRPHKRISQIANVIAQRTKVIAEKNKSIDKGRSGLASRYYEFLKRRTKIKSEEDRKKLKFT